MTSQGDSLAYVREQTVALVVTGDCHRKIVALPVHNRREFLFVCLLLFLKSEIVAVKKALMWLLFLKWLREVNKRLSLVVTQANPWNLSIHRKQEVGKTSCSLRPAFF